MIVLVQRVFSATVEVNGENVGECGKGLLVFVCADSNDTESEAKWMADRVYGMRIFNDEAGKMNYSLAQVTHGKEPNVLVISNFTLRGDAVRSRRPGFTRSATYDLGKTLYESFVFELQKLGANCSMGIFGADMTVQSVGDGPVNLFIESPQRASEE